MRCAIHTCGWVCWLGVKVSISGERAVGGYNANKTSSRSAPKPPPLLPVPRCGCFEAESALYQPFSTNWTLTRAFQGHPSHERDTSIPTSDIDTTWAFGRVLCLFSSTKDIFAAVSCLAGARSVGGENAKLKLRDSTPRRGCLKPDLYLLFGQNFALTDVHNVVLGQPERTLKPQSYYYFLYYFFYTINPE